MSSKMKNIHASTNSSMLLSLEKSGLYMIFTQGRTKIICSVFVYQLTQSRSLS